MFKFLNFHVSFSIKTNNNHQKHDQQNMKGTQHTQLKNKDTNKPLDT